MVVVAAAFAACAGSSRVAAPQGMSVLIGDEWFAARAQQLGISAEEAKARDAAISDRTPPGEDGVDRFAREQAAAIWVEYCSKCHGLEGEPPAEMAEKPRTPREWGTFGTSMGFFFGGDKMRAGIFRLISEGGEEKDGVSSGMPAWGESLSREQTWAVVYHLESL